MESSPTTLWAIIGLLLITAEIFTHSFFLLFFGIGALLVALLRSLVTLPNSETEILLWATLGLVGVFIFRKKLMGRFKTQTVSFSDQHQIIVLDQSIPAHGEAHISYQGSTWIGVNPSHEVLHQGQKVKIARTEGIKLILQALSQEA